MIHYLNIHFQIDTTYFNKKLYILSHHHVMSVFQGCHLHSVAKSFGVITAQHRNSPLENTGLTFVGCKITGLVGGTVLGRPWGPYSRVIFAQTFMSDTVSPQGWLDWDDPSKQRCTLYPKAPYFFYFYFLILIIKKLKQCD